MPLLSAVGETNCEITNNSYINKTSSSYVVNKLIYRKEARHGYHLSVPRPICNVSLLDERSSHCLAGILQCNM